MTPGDSLDPPKLDSLRAAVRCFEPWFLFKDQTRESLFVAHVDERFNCLYFAQYDGDEISVQDPSKEILADALSHGSTGLFLAHNHPSGDLRPSDSDKRLTCRLAAAAEHIDCRVYDHLIFGGSDFISFSQMGLL